MKWPVKFHPAFDKEFQQMSPPVQEDLLATLKVLEDRGPQLGRPHADTLKGSKHTNMKELRLKADGGVWRFAFAFDPNREAVVLVGGAKQGMSQSLFYDQLMKRADDRFDGHLAKLEQDKALAQKGQQAQKTQGHKGNKR